MHTVLSGKTVPSKAQEIIAYNIFDGKKIAALLAAASNVDEGIEKANAKIMSSIGLNTQIVADEIRKHILNVIFNVSKDGELQRRYGTDEARRKIL